MLAEIKISENLSKNQLHIDKDQAKTHLEALGYKSGDNIYMRAFFPSDDTRSAIDSGRKADKLIYQQVEQWQTEGRGIYFVVNGGGHKNKDVKFGRAIFYEHDKLDKEVQLYLWETLGLPEPTIQVDTGGKSIHNYWVFDSPIPVEDWEQLQTDLLEFADGDRNIKNPSRVMRLAGAWHIKGDGTVNQSQIVSNSGKRYSYAQLREIIPPHLLKVQQPIQQQNGGEYPRHSRRWTDIDWAISYLNALQSYRVDNYEDWLLVGMALKSVDESLLTEWENWSRQSSKYKPGECEKKWNSFKSSGVSLGSLGHIAKQDGWKSPFEKTERRMLPKGNDGINNLIQPTLPELDINAVKEAITKFLKSAPDEIAIEIEKIKVRTNNPRLSEREVTKLFDLISKDLEKTESRTERSLEIDELLRLGEQSLNLADFLPPNLAQPIDLWCSWQNIRPEVALTTVLATTSSLHKTGTELIISKQRDFSVPTNMFAAIIAESGQKKSPTYRTFAKKPLRQLKKEFKTIYEQEYKEYSLECEEWNKRRLVAIQDKKTFDEPEPQPPKKPAPFYFNNATGEGITTAAAMNPEKTQYALIDELAGYFGSQNAYRNGRGSDKQEVLSYHDGEGKTVLRAGGVSVDVDQIYLSIFGTIQPEVIKRIMNTSQDEDGQWARFFFVNQPLAASELDEEDAGGIDLIERITGIYRDVFSLPVMRYELSTEAYKLYRPFYNHLEQLRVSHPQSGMRALYSKSEGHTGVLAVNLHILHSVAAGNTPSKEIPAEIMERAIALMKFYIGQTRLLYAEIDNELAPHLVKVMNFSKRKQETGGDGWVKVKEIQNSVSSKQRPSAEVVRGWFSELEKMGKGTTRLVGRSLEFNAEISKSQKSHTGAKSSTGENLTTNGLQPPVAKRAKVANFFENKDTPPPMEKEKDFSPKVATVATVATGGCKPSPEQVSAVDNSSTGTPTVATGASTPPQQPSKEVDIVDDSSTESTGASTESTGASTPNQQQNSEVHIVDNSSTGASTESTGASTPTQQQIAPGDKVIYRNFDSKRDGMSAIVKKISKVHNIDGSTVQVAVVRFDGVKLPDNFRETQCPVSWLEVCLEAQIQS